jgi:glycosyltransferase involved in cell wall biosynthesis
VRLGFVPALDPRGGGLHQYSVTVLGALRSLSSRDDFEVVIFASDPHSALLSRFADIGTLERLDPPTRLGRLRWATKRIVPEGVGRDLLRGVAAFVRRRALEDRDVIRPRPEMTAWLKQNGIDLMLYPGPDALSFEVATPAIVAVHDLQHRLQPHFPEVSAHGEWTAREYVLWNAARHALFLVADSTIGRDDILNLYRDTGITPDRVKVLPFVPPTYLSPPNPRTVGRVLERYELPADFLFYPAQFWSHKNHAGIVRAVALLKREGVHATVVFSGSNSGRMRRRTYSEVMRLSSRLGVADSIRYVGYVSDRDMSSMYSASKGLVMPTFFGPTNIPIVEAWMLGCPVLTSDLRGIRDQAGDAAVLVDPRSPESIAQGMRALLLDGALRARLVERGRNRVQALDMRTFEGLLQEILNDAKQKLAV